jgi:hypothetical protein
MGDATGMFRSKSVRPGRSFLGQQNFRLIALHHCFSTAQPLSNSLGEWKTNNSYRQFYRQLAATSDYE